MKRLICLICCTVLFGACDGETTLEQDTGTNVTEDTSVDVKTSNDVGEDTINNNDVGSDTSADAATDVVNDVVIEVPLEGTLLSSYGCKCDGTSDDSACIQTALDDNANWTNRILEWPSDQTCIAVGLRWQAPTGTEESPYVLRGSGSTLKAPDGHPVVQVIGDQILRVENGQWIRLEYLGFDGNRDTRIPAEVPAHSLLLMSSRDVFGKGVISINAVSDGIYVSSSDGPSADSRPQRIHFEDTIVRNAFRNNISVINALGFKMTGDGKGKESSCQLTDAKGTPPQAGIDFEPNAGNFAPGITDVVVEGCYIGRNFGTAILLHSQADPDGALIRNNLIEGDRMTVRLTCGAAMHLGFDNAIIEDNIFSNINIPVGCRSLFDFAAYGADHSSKTTIRNNRIENITGIPDIAQIFFIHPANQGGHSITGNTLVNIGVDNSGDWCLDAATTTASVIQDNTVDGVLQSPNPGCP